MQGIISKAKGLVRPVYQSTVVSFFNNRADSRIEKICKIQHTPGSKIKVGFVVQYPSCWDKQQPVFEAMLHNSRFDVCLICTADFDMVAFKLDEDHTPLDYYKSRYPDVKIYDFRGDKTAMLKDIYSLDYLFYDRYYSHYLPAELRPKKASKYNKICSIPYTSNLWNFYSHEIKFLRYLYMYFAQDRETEEYFNHVLGLRHRKFVYKGYPIFETVNKKKRIKNDKLTILWTPRWSYDPMLGGSHFLEYKDAFINLAKEYPVKLIFRPHPLMWDNFLSNGIMTQDEIDEYKQRLKENGIVEDKNTLIEDTFRETDVLISDLSSVFTMYGTTGNPMIYCPAGKNNLSGFMQRVVDASYVAESWDDVRTAIEKLLNGQDDKKATRELFLEHEFGNTSDISQRILNYVIKDYDGTEPGSAIGGNSLSTAV